MVAPLRALLRKLGGTVHDLVRMGVLIAVQHNEGGAPLESALHIPQSAHLALLHDQRDLVVEPAIGVRKRAGEPERIEIAVEVAHEHARHVLENRLEPLANRIVLHEQGMRVVLVMHQVESGSGTHARNEVERAHPIPIDDAFVGVALHHGRPLRHVVFARLEPLRILFVGHVFIVGQSCPIV